MPKALTMEEKMEKANQRVAERAEESTSKRQRRNVFNGTESKLSIRNTIPGYHLHILTDSGGRIQDALDSGYEFVTPEEVGGVSENVVSRNGDLGGKIRFLVNPRAEGSEQYGYLMKQRLEWYEEDQLALQTKNNQIDNAIRKGKITGDNNSFYNAGIKVS